MKNRLLQFVTLSAIFTLGVGAGQTAKPKLAVVQFTTNGEAKVTRESTRAADTIENALIKAQFFNMQTRLNFSSLIGEDRLSATGITDSTARDIAERQGVDYLVVGDVSVNSSGFEVVTKMLEYKSARIINSSLLGTDETNQNTQQWGIMAVRDLLNTNIFKVTANVKQVLPNKLAVLDKGTDDNLTLVLGEGTINRKSPQIDGNNQTYFGDFTIVREAPTQTTISYEPFVPTDEIRIGDIANTTFRSRAVPSIAPAAQAVITLPVSNNFVLYALNKQGKEISSGAAVKIGDEITLRFTSPIAGFVYIVSTFPNDKNLYLLHPVSGFPAREAAARVAFIYPSARDVNAGGDRLKLVAEAPIGKTFLKAFVVPNPILQLQSDFTPLTKAALKQLTDAVLKAGDKASTGELVVDIVN